MTRFDTRLAPPSGLDATGFDATDVDRAYPDRANFRRTMSAFATGVTIVTTAVDDVPHGSTVSAFTSLSLDPALVLVCLSNAGRGCRLVERSGVFAVNVLAADQAWVAQLFADRARPEGSHSFRGVPFLRGATGCPVLIGAAAHLDCRLTRTVAGGDHTIVIGEVVGLSAPTAVEPLLFHAGRYRQPGELERTPAAA